MNDYKLSLAQQVADAIGLTHHASQLFDASRELSRRISRVRGAFKRGAAGYLLKDEPLASLLPLAVRDVVAGRAWFSPRASQSLIQPKASEPPLTDYQHEVLRRL